MAVEDARYLRLADAEPTSQLTLRVESIEVEGFDLRHVFEREFCRSASAGILGHRNGLHVVGVDAGPLATQVVQDQALWQSNVVIDLEDSAMSVASGDAVVELPVTACGMFALSPYPARSTVPLILQGVIFGRQVLGKGLASLMALPIKLGLAAHVSEHRVILLGDGGRLPASATAEPIRHVGM